MDNKDTWETEATGLSLTDPLEKLTESAPFKRSEDRKGHDGFLGARFPKDMTRWVTKIKEKGQYQMNSDVVRDAIWLGLQILSLRYQADPQWQVNLQLMTMANETAWEARMYDEEEEFAHSLDKFCTNGDEGRAIEALRERLTLLSSAKQEKRQKVLLDRLEKYRLKNLVKKAQI